jgi:iron-sulfur cluster repair protein YtfE (RIC family)
MISRHYFEDHRENDALFARLRHELNEPRGPAEEDARALRVSFRQFEERLERHIRSEEQDLFPAVESRTPDLAQGPGIVLRSEHEDLRSRMGRIGEYLDAGPVSPDTRRRFRELLQGVEELLGDHNQKEETVYHPICDRLLTQREADRIVRRLHVQE